MTVILRNWWYLVLRGAVSILFGAAALMWPKTMITTLVLLFGAYATFDGLIAILYGLSMSREGPIWILIVEGTIGVLMGMVMFLWPTLTALGLLYLIAAWAIVTGILEIVTMSWLRRVANDSLLLGLSGVFSVVLGVTLFFVPHAGMVAAALLLGIYALVFGEILVWVGLRLRRLYLADAF